MGSSHGHNKFTRGGLDDVPGAGELLLGGGQLSTSQVVAPDPFYPGNVPNLFSVQVCFPDQVILYVTKQYAVLSRRIYKVAHTLRVVKLRFRKVALNITNSTVANLLDKLVRCSVKDQVPVV